MATTNVHLLLVEDDERLSRLIELFLSDHGFRVERVADGVAAVDAIPALEPDCVVLDVLLPGLDGIEVCKRVRTAYGGWILMLSACSDDIDEVVGLDVGADDYLAKPVRPQVLLARLRALLRRGSEQRPNLFPVDEPALSVDCFSIDPGSRTVAVGGERVNLTDAEFDLLWLLARHAPAVLSRDDILVALRGVGHDGVDRSIDMRVSKLRRKLGDVSEPHRLIKTVRGQGYMFAAGTALRGINRQAD